MPNVQNEKFNLNKQKVCKLGLKEGFIKNYQTRFYNIELKYINEF